MKILASLVCGLGVNAATEPNPFPNETSLKATAPSSWYSIMPHFKVPALSWPSITPIMRRFASKSKDEPGTVATRWSTAGDTVQFRGVYETFDAMHRQQEMLSRLVDEMLDEGLTELSRLEIVGPRLLGPSRSMMLDPSLALKADYFENEDGFFVKVLPDEPEALVNSNQYFEIKDWMTARPIMKEFMEVTSQESDCLYSSWSKKGDGLLLQESHVNGESAVKHFELTGISSEAAIGKSFNVNFTW